MSLPQKFVIRESWEMGGEYRIAFGVKTSDGKWAMAQPATLKVLDDGDASPSLLLVEQDALQSLMDELWNVGIRPKNIGTAGHLAATQEHLKDMKKLVSKAFDVAL